MIIHVDMDAFFAAVEQRDDPSLRGRPVIVGGERTSRRGVVATASYEARRFGVRSAMPIAEAVRRCPQGVFMRGNHTRYREVHEQLVTIWQSYTPAIKVVSIDEAFLDVAGCERLFGTPAAIAREIQDRIGRELGLSASFGVARTARVAKVASEHAKPHGLTVVDPGAEAAFLAPKPIQALWGVGPVMAEKLRRLGLELIGDLAAADAAWLEPFLGNETASMQAMARGEGPEGLSPSQPRKQVGSEETFAYDLTDREALAAVLMEQAREVAATLRRKGVMARKLTLKLRDRRFQTQTRQMRLPAPSDQDLELYRTALTLFDRHWHGEPIRLIGISAGDLGEAEVQMGLFEDPGAERRRQVSQALDAISAKFGAKSLTWAKTLMRQPKGADPQPPA
jgi:DNA polymerase-4